MECSVGEVAVREARLLGDDAAADSLTPEVTVAMMVGAFEEAAGAS